MAQAVVFFMGIIIASVLVSFDTLTKVYLNPFGVFCIVAAFLLFFGFGEYFTKTIERAKFGARLIGFLLICPWGKLAFFDGNSFGAGRFFIMYISLIFAFACCAASVLSIWEPKAKASELNAKIEEENRKKQAEIAAKAKKAMEEENRVQHCVQSFVHEEVKDADDGKCLETQNNLQGYQTNVGSQVDPRFAPYRPYDNKPQKSKKVSSYGNDLEYFVKVKFPDSEKTYDYLCTDTSIGEGDVVRVRARGRIKNVTVVDSFFRFMKDMPLPANKYKYVIVSTNNYDIDEEEIARKEEEEFRRDLEEDARRFALEDAKELRAMQAEEARNRQVATILAYQAASASSYSSSRDDDWTSYWNSDDDDDDDGRIFDSRGNMINGKLRAYERSVRKTGIANEEYRLELMDDYIYCNDHEEYDDCHYGHDDCDGDCHDDDYYDD